MATHPCWMDGSICVVWPSKMTPAALLPACSGTAAAALHVPDEVSTLKSECSFCFERNHVSSPSCRPPVAQMLRVKRLALGLGCHMLFYLLPLTPQGGMKGRYLHRHSDTSGLAFVIVVQPEMMVWVHSDMMLEGTKSGCWLARWSKGDDELHTTLQWFFDSVKTTMLQYTHEHRIKWRVPAEESSAHHPQVCPARFHDARGHLPHGLVPKLLDHQLRGTLQRTPDVLAAPAGACIYQRLREKKAKQGARYGMNPQPG